MGLLVRGNRLEIAVESRIETGFGEIGLRVVGETFTIKFVLEMLQSESVVEDISIRDGWSLTLEHLIAI